MKLLPTVLTASISSLVAAFALQAFQTPHGSGAETDWMPTGTLLLISHSTSCPFGWIRRASVLANLDEKTSDDFSFQDFDYVVRSGSPQLVRLQTCQKGG